MRGVFTLEYGVYDLLGYNFDIVYLSSQSDFLLSLPKKVMTRLNDFMVCPELAPISNYCLANGTVAKYAKGQSFVDEGSLCRYIAVVRSGYFKFSVIDNNGDECTTGFSFAGDIVADYVYTFLNSQPSPTNIIAGADSEVLRVPVGEIRAYLDKVDSEYIARTANLLLKEAYRRYIDMHRFSPEERYLKLIGRVPGLLTLVPLRELASYLSVSRRQFQRIRAQTGHLSHDR